jgi:hypothetical protein
MENETTTRPTFWPGPYESFDAPQGKRARVGILRDGKNILIADVGERQMSQGEINATARLLAAAPDLFDALLFVRGHTKHDSPAMWKRIDDALAKAVNE